MPATRVLLGALGVATGAWGIKLLLDQGGDNLVATLSWLVGGVVLHDGVIGPLVIATATCAGLVLRGRVPRPLLVGAVVLSTVTLVAVPVLGRFGARADNRTLLDRNYGVGWLVFAGVTLLVVVVALVRDRAVSRRSSPTSPGET